VGCLSALNTATAAVLSGPVKNACYLMQCYHCRPQQQPVVVQDSITSSTSVLLMSRLSGWSLVLVLMLPVERCWPVAGIRVRLFPDGGSR